MCDFLHFYCSIFCVSEEHDLALLRTELQTPKWFSFAEHPPEIGSTIVAGGFESGPSAGKILSLTRPSSEKDLHILSLHDAPVVPGDSGGPLLNSEGELLGINYQLTIPRFHEQLFRNSPLRQTRAILIQEEWLHQLIEKDRMETNPEMSQSE